MGGRSGWCSPCLAGTQPLAVSLGFSPTVAPLLGLLSPEGGELVSCFSQGWLWVLEPVLSRSLISSVGSGDRQSAVMRRVCPSGGVGEMATR